MKSLFLKIFLSFWLAHALFLIMAIAVTLAFRPSRGSWEAVRNRTLNEAVQAYEQGGPGEARENLEQLTSSQHIRAFLFDDSGREITERPVPQWVEDFAHDKPMHTHGFPMNLMPNRFLRQSMTGRDGHSYMLVLDRMGFQAWDG